MNEKILKKKDKPEELIRAENLINEGKFDEAFKIIKGIEKRGDLTPKSQNKCTILKSDVLSKRGRFRDSIKLAEKAYKESQRLNDKKQSVESLLPLARSLLLLGELEIGFEKIEACKELLRTLKGKPKEIKRLEVQLGKLLGAFYVLRGDVKQALQYEEKALALAQEIGDKGLICDLHNNLGVRYRNLGDLDRALEYAERGFALHEEYFNNADTMGLAYLLTTIIQIYIDKSDLEKAQNYLQRLEQLNHQEDNKLINLFYRCHKAIILKSIPRARNRVLAEDLFRQIVDEEIISFESWVHALINLCDLLLVELRMTNIVEIVDEIRPIIGRLLEIAEDIHSNWLIVEAYILQAKLSLLTFDIKQAKRFLTQAQQIAERYGLNQLATKISDEHEDLLKKSDLWEKLEEKNAPMSDRLELARLDEQIEGIVKSRTILTAQIREEKVAISKERKICLVCRGEVFGFSYICKCGANYCENCARALTNLENVCWACEVPIDYLKPVKPFKDEMEKMKVEEKTKEK
jgi:tetratricopeptide (TPR) repeat protein